MSEGRSQVVPAVHGRKVVEPDAAFERGLADYLRSQHDGGALAEIYGRFV
jgi:hypothetical protein